MQAACLRQSTLQLDVVDADEPQVPRAIVLDGALCSVAKGVPPKLRLP